MISASDIHKSYDQVHVLKGINLLVKKNEIVTIVGPSGAGKSTLLHILGTLDTPDKGEISMNGVAFSNLKGKKLANFRNRHIGFIFQFHHLLPEFSALENVSMPGLIAGQNKAETFRKARELLVLLGLSERLEHKPSQLSGGELQRIAVARALINQPTVVLADEPSGNLDTTNATELHQMFLKLRENLGQTFIIVTHNQQLAGMSDRVIQMKDGMIIDSL
jgi:lipoprotein-releasing system ATP-binding protein